MLTTSEQINEIAAAIASAQTEIGHAGKDRDNPAFRSKYATLASVDDAVRPHLSKRGVCIIQAPRLEVDGNGLAVSVETRLIHSSGQWMASTLTVPCAKSDAHAVGSATTYARRFALAAMCGVAPDDDDDANEAVGKPASPRNASAPRTAAKPASQPAPAPQSERPAQATPATASHDASWTDRRVAFCTALGDLGLTYDDVAAYCDSIGKPRPSAMDEPSRRALYGYLESPKGKTTMAAFVKAHAKPDDFPSAWCPTCHAAVEPELAEEVARMRCCPACPKPQAELL